MRGLQETQQKDSIMSRREIVDLAVKDSAIIKTALSSQEPLEELKKAEHLVAAYKGYLHLQKVEMNAERPWGRTPQSQVCCFTEPFCAERVLPSP